MFYPKNVPNWERVLRLIAGIALITAAFIILSPGPLLAMVLIVGGLSAVITGFVGWCPACALVGRKIKHQQARSGL